MRALYWRIYLTVLVCLLAFALGAGWLLQQQREPERAAQDEPAAWWVCTADDGYGDGWDEWWRVVFPSASPPLPVWLGPGGMLALLAVLYVGIAAGAYPIVRRLTRRLETLRAGVEAFGDGRLAQRVPVQGHDEVAALAASFNRAAQRIEHLVNAHRTLLTNASHELRSPLARLRLALSLLQTDSSATARAAYWQEIERNLHELDALIEEILLASRLDAVPTLTRAPVDLLALAAEECAVIGAELSGEPVTVCGDERLLRRALRNLLENAHRYAPGQKPQVHLQRTDNAAELRVCDRGPGVAEALRERVFEPFFRLPGHAEHTGGVGLGLSLVRQIARSHGGDARCEARSGGGSCYVLCLPLGSGTQQAPGARA